jgi:hypothetical protein
MVGILMHVPNEGVVAILFIKMDSIWKNANLTSYGMHVGQAVTQAGISVHRVI